MSRGEPKLPHPRSPHPTPAPPEGPPFTSATLSDPNLLPRPRHRPHPHPTRPLEPHSAPTPPHPHARLNREGEPSDHLEEGGGVERGAEIKKKDVQK